MSPETLTAQTEPLVSQLGHTHQVLKDNAADLTQEESLVQPQPAGNCLNWVVGHVIATRNEILQLVGKPPIWSKEEAARYGRNASRITGEDEGGRAVIRAARGLGRLRGSDA